MKVKVQLVQNNPLHKVPTILVNINRSQFMFNVIPTLLRHRKKHKLNLYNSSSIFFTKNSIQAMGGLPNFLLFRSGTEHSNSELINKIYLFGDNQLIRYFQKLRFKLGYKILRVSYTDWDKKMFRFGIFSYQLFKKIQNDHNLPSIFSQMQAYLPRMAKFKQYYDSRYYIRSQKTKYIDLDCVYYHSNLLDIYPLFNKTGKYTVTSYIIVLAEQKKGIDVNVQKFSKQTKITKVKNIKDFLQNGQISLNGIKYLKKDYLFRQNFKPTNIIILHYENINSIEELLNNEIFNNYFQNNNKTGLVVHIVQEIQLIESELMKKLINKFEKTTKHLWYNHLMNDISSAQQTLLEDNLIYSSIWNEFFSKQVKNIQQERFKYYKQIIKIKMQDIFPNITHYLYKRVFNYVKNDYLGDLYQQRVEKNPTENNISILKRLVKHQFNLTQKKQSQIHHNDLFQPKLIMLGTASSMPIVDRNTSGILVTLFKNHSILFDCGEQTYQQIVNHFSPTQLEEQMLKIRVIFITHIHSDHNIGILNLISSRAKIMKKQNKTQKLFLIIPFNVFNWFQSYNQTIQDLSDSCQVIFTQYLLNQSFEQSQPKQNQKFFCSGQTVDYKLETELESSVKNKGYIKNYLKKNGNLINQFHNYLKQAGYSQFSPVRVIHCPQSFGIVVKSNELKVSYSGDTRPSLDFQKLAEKSNLMIHQATFNDQQAKNAQSYLHSTVQQAVTIGLYAKADNLVLTHFNQDFRPPKAISNPVKNEYFNKNTIMAFDHLQFKLNKPNNLCQISKHILRVNNQVELQLKKLKTKIPKQGNDQK